MRLRKASLSSENVLIRTKTHTGRITKTSTRKEISRMTMESRQGGMVLLAAVQ